MRIREVMTSEVVTAVPGCSVRQIAELMRERNVGSVVLTDDDGALAGFITDRDLAVGVVADGRDGSDAALDHASSPVVTVGADEDVQEAAHLMVEHGIRRLPVLDGERLTGIVTLDDLTVRIGDLELARHMSQQITSAALPGFYFHEREQ
jgi:CBS domain-containing protein